jgi:ATP-dependent Clp protease ATP-binding subunit ClpC
VVLLDEVEKAHPDVMNILLQILEDGFLSDAKGRKVSFKNTVVILTSNVGTGLMNRQAKMGFTASAETSGSAYETLKEKVLADLKKSFRPEFINRIDKIIVFKPLAKEDIRKIVDLQLGQLSQRLAKQKISLEISPSARDLIADQGYDPESGARPVRRVIQNTIEDGLAEGILKGRFGKNSIVKVEKRGSKIVLHSADEVKAARR